jgi:hypothetical protein
MRNLTVDPNLYQYATRSQVKWLDAITEHGSGVAAALALGYKEDAPRKALNAVKKAAALAGYAPGASNITSVSPAGFTVKRLSARFNSNGEPVGGWLISEPSKERQLEALKQAVDDVVADMRGLSQPTPPPEFADTDLLTVIPLGDPHFGMLAWAKESGEDFDLEIAERLTVNAVDRLCAMTPATETALLLNLGDFFHADNGSNRTPRGGNELDVDGRFQKIASIGFRAMIRCVDRLLQKHAKVIVRNNRGNHDPHQAAMLTIAMEAYYHENPRVTVDASPSGFFYYRFGRTLIGSTHGDGAKLADLPIIMASDRKDDWAASDFRVWHCGHFHHDQVKEHVGCTVETHRTLAATDAWHNYQGYRSGRDMKAVIYHREFGEMSRVRCGVERLET